jgi:beta-lactam-binding protein with PASTA domain
MSKNSKFSFDDLRSFIFSRLFVKHIGLVIVFYIAVALILLLWLRFYTHHGQKLELPDYTNMNFENASKEATADKFNLIVEDSIHIIGKKGGLIIDQNPNPGSKVKQNRNIYVNITKYRPDRIKLEDLPTLYGRNYETKKKELGIIGVKSRIAGYAYDKGEPNYILEVQYRGKPVITRQGYASGVEIEKGSTLDFTLSRQSGGITNLPDLRCMTVGQAIFLIESRRLVVGIVTNNGVPVDDYSSGYIISQDPQPSDELVMESRINLQISDVKPAGCD